MARSKKSDVRVTVEHRRLKPPKQKPRLRVAFVLDESGSMATRAGQVIGGFNEYLRSLQREKKVRYEVTLTKFSTWAKTVFANRPVAEVEELSLATYAPAGGTALVDAVGDTIRALEAQQEHDEVPALVVIMTDGEENSSSRWRTGDVRDLIRDKEARKGWSFVFLGADMNAWAHAQGYGFSVGNVIRYNSFDTKLTFTNLATATRAVACNYVADGSAATANFSALADFQASGNKPVDLTAPDLTQKPKRIGRSPVRVPLR